MTIHLSPNGMIACLLTVLLFSKPVSAQITLPIEVMGTPNTTRSISLTLPADAPLCTALKVRLHNLEYPGEVSVQINSLPFLSLDNTTATTDPVAASWGGIGGPIATQTLLIPLPQGAFVSGSNTLTFRFNKSDGNCTGFRILSLNVVRADGSLVVDPAQFVQEDPTLWQSPFTDAGSLSLGKRLWQGAPLRASSLPNAHLLKAHCGDCHAADGRDLKYFNYSTLSIVTRSQFHGLSEVQGKQIASYIRTLTTPSPGRPWNPPYQPGAGLDSRPASAWSAGAGFDAVLSSDAQMLPFLFPNGVTLASTSPQGSLNLREVPIALPLPDWNRWLPKVHPIDTWGNKFAASDYAADYPALYASLASQQAAGQLNAYLSGPTNPLNRALYQWSSVDKRSFDIAHVNPIALWTPALSEAVHSTMRWHLVKEWEIMQTFDLEGKSALINGNGPLTEPRSWYSNTAFGTSPKAAGIPEGPTGVGGSALYQHYFADAWYQLQTIVNPGNGHRSANFPVDWPYFYGVVYHTALLTGQSDGLRWTALLVKASQESANGIAPSPLDRGWNPTRVASLFLWGAFLPSFVWQGADPAISIPIVNSYAQGWLTQCQQFTPQQYYAAGTADPHEVANPTLNMLGPSTRFVDQTYWMIPMLRAQGADATTLNAICDWAKILWPNNNWNGLKSKQVIPQ